MKKILHWFLLLVFTGCTGQQTDTKSDSTGLHNQWSTEDSIRFHQTMTLDNWDKGGDLSRYVYLRTSEFFPSAIIQRQSPVSELVYQPDPAIGDYILPDESGSNKTLNEFIKESPLDGFIILHRGRIVYETYPRMKPDDHHLMFSVTKALVGTVVGILEDRGEIDIDNGIEVYLNELKETAWAGISIRNIMDMSSGMEQSEFEPGALTDPLHKHYQLEASLGWLALTSELPEIVQTADTYEFLKTLERMEEPGVRWWYTSTNTAVLGWLLESVTGRPLAEVLSEEIWSRIGAESNAYIVLNRKGIPVAHGGMSATLRDLARFGLLFTESWNVVSNERVISEEYLRRIREDGQPGLFGEGENRTRPEWHSHAAYHWDNVTNEGAIIKGGFAGQILAIFPYKDVVIAYYGTNEDYESEFFAIHLRAIVDDLF